MDNTRQTSRGPEYAQGQSEQPIFMTGDSERFRNELNNMLNESDPTTRSDPTTSTMPSPDTVMTDSDSTLPGVMTDSDRNLPELNSLFNSFNKRIQHLETLYL